MSTTSWIGSLIDRDPVTSLHRYMLQPRWPYVMPRQLAVLPIVKQGRREGHGLYFSKSRTLVHAMVILQYVHTCLRPVLQVRPPTIVNYYCSIQGLTNKSVHWTAILPFEVIRSLVSSLFRIRFERRSICGVHKSV